MIEKIDLSNFVNRQFSRSGLKELVEGMKQLPCLRSVVLRNNGITDNFVEEIDEMFNN